MAEKISYTHREGHVSLIRIELNFRDEKQYIDYTIPEPGGTLFLKSNIGRNSTLMETTRVARNIIDLAVKHIATQMEFEV